MKLFGREGDRETFRKLTGHPQQLVGCELFESLDGEMRSQRVMRIRNGEIELEILLDRGFDIGRLLFRGVPMQWVSPAGFRHPHSLTPHAAEPEGWGWLRSWPGGFLTTAGYDHVGAPALKPNRHLHPGITGEWRYPHGFASFSPSSTEQISVDWEAGIIFVQGQVRQAAPYAEALVLTRRIEMNIGEPSFRIHDSVRNEGFIEEPIQLLYHFNLGWPLLAPGSRVTSSCPELLASSEAAAGVQYQVMPEPTPLDVERVWDWHALPGPQWAQLENENFAGGGSMKLRVSWDGSQLPHFVQWRNATEGMYVQGLEPSTTGIKGHSQDNSHAGPAPMIAPGQSRDFSLVISMEQS